MPRSTFTHDLDGVLENIQLLHARVDKAIEDSMEALLKRDLTLARSVAEGDSVINEQRYEIEEAVINALLGATDMTTLKPVGYTCKAIDADALLEIMHRHGRLSAHHPCATSVPAVHRHRGSPAGRKTRGLQGCRAGSVPESWGPLGHVPMPRLAP